MTHGRPARGVRFASVTAVGDAPETGSETIADASEARVEARPGAASAASVTVLAPHDDRCSRQRLRGTGACRRGGLSLRTKSDVSGSSSIMRR